MVTRIPTGTAGVYRVQRAKGTVYVARWRDKHPATGKPRVRSMTFPTQAAAKVWLNETKHAKDSGTYVDPTAGRVSFREVAEDWLAEAATGDARPQTVEKYRANLAAYALPTFGERQVAGISNREIGQWLRELRTSHGKPPMPATIRRAYYPLLSTFRYARRYGLITTNPCEDVVVPRAVPAGREKVAGHFLTRQQVAALAAEVGRTDPVYAMLVRFAAGVGLRTSEIAGLRVRDLRLARREVNVERTAKNLPGTGWVFEEPKSKRSRRRVPILDDALLHDLGVYLAAHPRRDELDAPLWPGRGRPGLDYGSAGADHLWDALLFYKTVYRPAVAAVGLPAEAFTGVRFHDLRHTCGSTWIEDGIDTFLVSRWLGHSSIAFTDKVYLHTAKEPDYVAALAKVRAARAAQSAS